MNSNDFLNEDIVTDANDMHQDHEVQMARQECYHAAERAIAVHKLLRHVNEAEGLEGWVSAKITLANDYFKTVHDYLEYQLMTMNSPVQAEVLPIAEGSLNELSVNALSSYGKKAEKSARRNAELSVKHQEKAFDKYNKGGASADRSWDDQEKAEKYAAISDKRNAGANLAAAKLAKKFSKGVAEGMFTKDPAIDPIIGKEINNIINRLYIRAKRTKDEYLLGTVQELFAILRNTGGTYSPPGSPGVRDVAEDASAGASSSGSVATVVKGGKGGTNLLGGPEYKGPNPFKKKKSK